MKERLWTRNFILALVITIGVNLACNLLLSTISIYAKQITSTDAYAGVMTGAFTLAALFIRIVAGKMLDKIGRRKVLMFGVGITVLSTVAYLLTNNIYIIIFLRVMQGVGFGISSTAIATIVTDVTPESRMLEGIGYSGVGITITTAIGPSIALALVGENYDKFNVLFIVTAAVALFTILLSFKLSYKEVVSKKEEGTCDGEGISISKIIIPSIVLFIAAVAESTILAFAALYGIELGFSNIGLFFTINAMGILASRLFINQIVNKLGTNVVVSSGVLIFAASIFGIAVTKTYIMLIIMGFLCGVMVGSLLPIVNLLILDSASKSSRGMANAIYYALIDGGYGIGSIMWGQVVVACGYRWIYAYSSISLVVAFLIFVTSIVKSKRKSSEALGC
ncbi:MFS transporter [Clostridium paraputrificum]|nr:MFS transporter [Clostridium paraputrificum]MDB2075123.1 MFS transporter [Clostridium paraputrificum]MDB2078464.1 MFS transporter [Clostridium paraputrificum]MDB2099161.1 MFS transporter [Clostridium paraputrificum]MDB2117062.1 MFS transporter [Clostridium paraputrificum]MDB2124069.1 MFS transporter [Clostridium paraputrificum]